MQISDVIDTFNDQQFNQSVQDNEFKNLNKSENFNNKQKNQTFEIKSSKKTASLLLDGLDESSLLLSDTFTENDNNLDQSNISEKIKLNKRETLKIFQKNKLESLKAENEEKSSDDENNLNFSILKDEKPKLSFLESHKEPNDEDDETMVDDEPQLCGKIGKRASRFSVYGQFNVHTKNSTTNGSNEYTENIEELNESSFEESHISKTTENLFRMSSVSNQSNPQKISQAQAPNQFLIPNTEFYEEISDSIIQKNNLTKSKFQENLLNFALQGSPKHSLKNQSKIQFEKNSIFSNKNQSEIKQEALKNLNLENEIHNQIKKLEEENKMKKAFEKKVNKIETPLYRDSCDVNVLKNKSVINFFNHWKLNEDENVNNKKEKAKFKEFDQENNIQKKSISQSVNSGDFDIFDANFDSTIRESINSNSTNKSIRKLYTNIQHKQSIFNQSDSENKSSNENYIPMFNLLSDKDESYKQSANTMTLLSSPRDSIFNNQLSILSEVDQNRNSDIRFSANQKNLEKSLSNKFKKKFSVASDSKVSRTFSKLKSSDQINKSKELSLLNVINNHVQVDQQLNESSDDKNLKNRDSYIDDKSDIFDVSKVMADQSQSKFLLFYLNK